MTDPIVGIGINDPRSAEVAASGLFCGRSLCVAFGLKLYPSRQMVSKVSSARI